MGHDRRASSILVKVPLVTALACLGFAAAEFRWGIAHHHTGAICGRAWDFHEGARVLVSSGELSRATGIDLS